MAGVASREGHGRGVQFASWVKLRIYPNYCSPPLAKLFANLVQNVCGANKSKTVSPNSCKIRQIEFLAL
jgi:hypothetical protein